MKTDTQIRRDVTAELEWDPSVNATQIGVQVADGVVTLTGHVGSYAEKVRAEVAAQRVAGVRALAVELEVALPGPAVRTDADLAASAANVLVWNASLPPTGLEVVVEDGIVTLTGALDWEYQREVALGAVRHLLGVRGVNDGLTLANRATGGTVKHDIQAALARRAHTDGERIDVDVSGSTVTLRGTVQSWADRELANHAAWRSPGVHHVVDHLSVAW
jgi:osmotically-inducible protein OsmY